MLKGKQSPYKFTDRSPAIKFIEALMMPFSDHYQLMC